MIVGNSRGPATDEQVLDFLSFAVDRGIDVNQIWIAEAAGRLEWALLPVISPGRTMLLFSPTRLPPRHAQPLVAGLVGTMGEHFGQRGVVLSQMLIDPADRPVIAAYVSAGYTRLAELLYLQANVRGTEPLPALPPGWAMLPYSPEIESAFTATIAHSYEGSQDCPNLNGVRDVGDVIAGHKAAGDFDPRLWFLLTEHQQPLATLLLNRSGGISSVELVYLGVRPPARGRGVGQFLVRWALAIAALENRRHLSLAVDSDNNPALRVYYQNGLARVGSRVALVRDLRPPAVRVTIPERPAVL